jgi:hypothetical protein
MNMPFSKLPWRFIAGASVFSALLYIIFQSHIDSTYTSLKNLLANSQNPKSIIISSSNCDSNSSHTVPRTFYSSVTGDPSGWAQKELSADGGMIVTQFNETYTVSYGISMFHSLHCLEMLKAHILPEAGLTPHHTKHKDGPKDDESEAMKHLAHCIDYVIQVSILATLMLIEMFHMTINKIQGIKCGADATLEPPELSRDPAGNIVRQQVSGHGSTHMCGRTDYLYDMVDKSEKTPMPWFEWKAGATAKDLVD